MRERIDEDLTELETRIDEAVRHMSDAELAVLYANVIDVRERIGAVGDVLSLIAGRSRPAATWEAW